MTVTDQRPARSSSTAAEPIPAVVARLRETYRGGRTRPLAWRLGQLEALETAARRARAGLRGRHRRRSRAQRGRRLAGRHRAGGRRVEVRPQAPALLGPSAALWRCRWPRSPARPGCSANRSASPGSSARGTTRCSCCCRRWSARSPPATCSVIKPSEHTPAVSALLARLLPQYLDADTVAVVEGAADETQELIDQKLDHCFFTGGPEIGKHIMAAAAKHLTPVTLELGGKSPVIVADDAAVRSPRAGSHTRSRSTPARRASRPITCLSTARCVTNS